MVVDGRAVGSLKGYMTNTFPRARRSAREPNEARDYVKRQHGMLFRMLTLMAMRERAYRSGISRLPNYQLMIKEAVLFVSALGLLLV